VVKYSLEIKRSAQKELDALDDALFTGSIAKYWRWQMTHTPWAAGS
jgi:hypothetical protein